MNIKGVSQKTFPDNLKQGTKKTAVPQQKPKVCQYADSFVKHSAQSAPMLLALTGLWTVFDSSRSIPLKKAAINNIKNFFLPVIIASSALLAVIENKK